MLDDGDLKVLALRYPGVCVDCGHPLDPGTKAYWDESTGSVMCIVCPTSVADPFALLSTETIARGTAGRSAGAEFQRRLRRSLTPATIAWRKGQEGEVALGELLDRRRTVERDIEVLHDRRIPGSKANIDHIVIAPSAVYVVNAKKWTGKIEVKNPILGTDRLIVGGRDRTRQVESSAEEGRVVEEALESDVPVRAALCFVEGEWAGLWRSSWVNGTLVASPRGLLRRLGKAGPIGAGGRDMIARQLAEAFPEA